MLSQEVIYRIGSRPFFKVWCRKCDTNVHNVCVFKMRLREH